MRPAKRLFRGTEFSSVQRNKGDSKPAGYGEAPPALASRDPGEIVCGERFRVRFLRPTLKVVVDC
jgi:hypothetical protein